PPRPPSSTLFPYTTLFRSAPRLPAPRGTGICQDVRRASPALSDGHPYFAIAGGAGRPAGTGEQAEKCLRLRRRVYATVNSCWSRSEEHTSELQSLTNLGCR